MPDPNIKKYLETQGIECPFCGKGSVLSTPLDYDGHNAWSDTECHYCGRKWQDWFELRGIKMPDGTYHAAPVTVVIEVHGGVAEVVECPDDVTVVIRDLDTEEA